jgi:hypothetical protein
MYTIYSNSFDTKTTSAFKNIPYFCSSYDQNTFIDQTLHIGHRDGQQKVQTPSLLIFMHIPNGIPHQSSIPLWDV